MVSPEIIAVIPARAGSKRIPDKNIIDFFGKPLLAHTIEAAIDSGVFKRVIVSTEDVKIKKIAEKYNAEVPFLRTRAFDDFSGVEEATLFTLNTLSTKYKENFDITVQLLPTCPLRDKSVIQEAVKYFIKHNLNFLISCFEYSFQNPCWALKRNPDGTAVPFHPELFGIRSQDQPRLYCPSGAIWAARTKHLLDTKTFYGPAYHAYPIDWKKAVDIDNYSDLEIAKAVYQSLHASLK